jgi:hypothetical protein
MRKTLQILSFLMISFSSLNGQNLSQDYIDSWIKSAFLISEIDTNAVYMLNTEPLQCTDCDFIWKKYLQSDIVQVNFFDASENNSLHNDKDLILVWTVGSQSDKIIKEKYKSVKKKFAKRELKTTANIDTSLKEPVLIINDRPVFHSDCYEEIRELNKKNIIGIGIMDRPVSEAIYGMNGINGLIIIKID